MATTKYLDHAGLALLIDKLYERGFNGMGLSHEDFTAELKTRLSSLYDTLKDFDPSSVAADSTLTQLRDKVDGLEAVINSAETADGDKVINKLNEVFAFLADVSSDDRLKAILDGKVDKAAGKGLSTNDYTASDKAQVGKVAGLETDVASLKTASGTHATKTELAQGLASKVDSADIAAITAEEIAALVSQA